MNTFIAGVVKMGDTLHLLETISCLANLKCYL
jgi:hypothetical protein